MVEQSFQSQELRRAFGMFLTGVTVLTMRDPDGKPRGMTANSFTSVSLDPALLLVCVGRHSSNYEAFSQTTSFAVHVLGERHRDVATAFATRGIDRFSIVSHRAAATGAPVLEDCVSWFDCELHERLDAGDHMVLIGRVQAFGTEEAAPLGYFRGKFVGAATRGDLNCAA